MNPEEFPELPKIDIENSIEMEQNSLKDMVRKLFLQLAQKKIDLYLQVVYLK